MPNTIIHILADVLLFFGFYYFEKIILKRDFNVKFVIVQLVGSNLIDLDHLFATPIFDASRCSINFHLFHSWYFFPVYFGGLFFKKYKYFFAGVILHLILDYFDCFI